MTETSEVVVIGGGVMGASIALHLAQRGFGRIHVLERDTLCAGSTGRSVASVDLLSQQLSVATLQVRSLHAFQHCLELYGDECGWVQTGFAVIAGPDSADGVRDVVEVVGAAGGQVELLSPAAYRALDPACACGEAAAIAWTPEAGYLDPVLLTNTLMNAARARGVTLRQGEAAIALCREGERVAGVRTRSGEIAAGVVVAAAGPWSADFLRSARIDLPLRPQRHAVAVLACPAEVSPRVSILDTVNLVYARPETGGLTICGSLDLRVGYDWINADDECPTPSLDYGLWVWERMVARYPGMERGELRKGWSGPITMSPDGQPLLGRLPLEGLYCACGFSGAGLKIAPAVGESLANLIAGDAAACEALRPLRPTRFAEGQPLHNRYTWGSLG
ncbi:MAG: FAD-binding oxidoreductase [Chloroflexi bacterium]|nr:FAD-binding oxidoreductase [Chloroflexota bacterium]